MIENISSETMQTRENGVTSLKYFKKSVNIELYTL